MKWNNALGLGLGLVAGYRVVKGYPAHYLDAILIGASAMLLYV